LVGEIGAELAAAVELSQRTGKPERRFKDFARRTRASWSSERRVIAKEEWTKGEANPRFIVTSLAREEHQSRHLYEKIYCARGDMENRIKECHLDLYADRTSARTMRANQLRLWLASMAYVLVCALRRIGLQHTQLATATCGTIRLKLLKIGALVRISVRRIKLAMPSAFPTRPNTAPPIPLSPQSAPEPRQSLPPITRQIQQTNYARQYTYSVSSPRANSVNGNHRTANSANPCAVRNAVSGVGYSRRRRPRSGFDITRQEVVSNRTVFERLVPALDLALRHRMIGARREGA
jgi:hypothetical protein